MARMTLAKFQKLETFYQMPKWIYNYDLKPVDREVFMISYDNYKMSLANGWINEKGEIFFINTQEKLANILRVDVRTIQKSFEKLINLGLLEAEKTNGNPTKYFFSEIAESQELQTSVITTHKNVGGQEEVTTHKNVGATTHKNVGATTHKNVGVIRTSNKNKKIRTETPFANAPKNKKNEELTPVDLEIQKAYNELKTFNFNMNNERLLMDLDKQKSISDIRNFVKRVTNGELFYPKKQKA